MAFAHHPAAQKRRKHGRSQGRPTHPLISPSFLPKLLEVPLQAVPSPVPCPCRTWAWCPQIGRPLEPAHRLNRPFLSHLRLRRTRWAAHHYLLCVLSATSFPSVREKLPQARPVPVRRRIPSPVSRPVDARASTSSAKIPASFRARVTRMMWLSFLLRLLPRRIQNHLSVAWAAPTGWSLPFHPCQLRMRK